MNERQKSVRKKKKSKILTKVSIIIWVCSLICLSVLGYFIYDANVLPTNYFIYIVIIFVLLLAIHGLFVFKKKTRSWALITINVFVVLFMGVEIFGTLKINDTIKFLRENLGIKFEMNIYNIVVNKDASYENVSDISGLTVKVFKDMDDVTPFEEAVKKKVDIVLDYNENAFQILSDLKDNKEDIVIVNSGNYDMMVSNDEDFEKQVKILDTITVETKVEGYNSGIDVTKDPFVIYLSGIDTRSGYLPKYSLSDVNIIIAINPQTRNILMVHIPRDYYVQISGTTGLKDKLTHAGTMGGVELSMATISELLEIDIPYFVRVNFNSVVNLVNAIGGIELYSDVDYSFNCYTDYGCTFYPGVNAVDGRCALAFARERYAYEAGDRHRGENQEQVIEKVIDKVSSSSTIISNYSDILNALNGTFETNINPDEITSLVKMQINDMKGWHIENANVTGSGASMPTYSYPNQNLYVMNPDMASVEASVLKLNEVLGTNEEEE